MMLELNNELDLSTKDVGVDLERKIEKKPTKDEAAQKAYSNRRKHRHHSSQERKHGQTSKGKESLDESRRVRKSKSSPDQRPRSTSPIPPNSIVHHHQTRHASPKRERTASNGRGRSRNTNHSQSPNKSRSQSKSPTRHHIERTQTGPVNLKKQDSDDMPPIERTKSAPVHLKKQDHDESNMKKQDSGRMHRAAHSGSPSSSRSPSKRRTHRRHGSGSSIRSPKHSPSPSRPSTGLGRTRAMSEAQLKRLDPEANIDESLNSLEWSMTPVPRPQLGRSKTDETYLKRRTSGCDKAKNSVQAKKLDRSLITRPRLHRASTDESEKRQHKSPSPHRSVQGSETDDTRLKEAARARPPVDSFLERAAGEPVSATRKGRRERHSDGFDTTKNEKDVNAERHSDGFDTTKDEKDVNADSRHRCRSRRHRNHHASSVQHAQLEHGVALQRQLSQDEENAYKHHEEAASDSEDDSEGSLAEDNSRRSEYGVSSLLQMPLAAASMAPKLVTGTAAVAAKTTIAATTKTVSAVGSGAMATANAATITANAVGSSAMATANTAANVMAGAATAALQLVPFASSGPLVQELEYTDFKSECGLRTSALGAPPVIDGPQIY